MTDDIIDFEAFVDRKLDRECEAEDRARYDAMIAFIRKSDDHANFALAALFNYAERVRDRSDAAVSWPYDCQNPDFPAPPNSELGKVFATWIEFAEEFLADQDAVAPEDKDEPAS